MQQDKTNRRAFNTVGISVSTSFAAGIPVKVVSQRLGHAHPSFTIHTYQHLLPGMSAEAAHRFADLIKPVDDDHPQPTTKHQVIGHAGHVHPR